MIGSLIALGLGVIVVKDVVIPDLRSGQNSQNTEGRMEALQGPAR